MHLYMYICLYITEMNDAMIQEAGGENSDYFVIIRHLHYLGKGIVLFKRGLILLGKEYYK